MSKETNALVIGLKKMLENRGSMAVNEVQLLTDVVVHLEEHEKKKGDDRLLSGAKIVELLVRFLLQPGISDTFSHITSNLIDKLR